MGAHVVQYGLFLLSWWTIGVGVFQGSLSTGRLLAWALLLCTLVPLRMLTTWCQGRLSVSVGALLQRLLLFGAMRLSPDDVKHEGVGALLGRAIEAQAVERMALGGGVMGALSVIELGMAVLVLQHGAGGLLHVAALLGWLVLTAWLDVHLARRRNIWTDRRLELTDVTVERMVGHRTRIARLRPERWHEGEDRGFVVVSRSVSCPGSQQHGPARRGTTRPFWSLESRSWPRHSSLARASQR